MSCDACDHTMQNVSDRQPPVFWCPRCGSIKRIGPIPDFVEPKLITRIRETIAEIANGLTAEGTNNQTAKMIIDAINKLRECCSFYDESHYDNQAGTSLTMIIKPGDVHDDFGKARLGTGLAAEALGVQCDLRLMTMWLVKIEEADRESFLEFAREFANK